MKRKSLFVGAAFVLAAFSLGAFDNYNEAFQAGRKAVAAKQFADAAKAYEEAGTLAKTPWQRYQAAFYWAEALRTQKNWAAAEKKLSEIIADEKTLPVHKATAQLYLGHYKNWQGKKEDALTEYGKVIAMGTKLPVEFEAFNGSGNLLLNMQKYQEAVASFRKTLAAEKVTPYAKGNANLGIARAAFLQKKYDDALKGYQAVLADESTLPNHRAEALCGIGRCYARQGKYEESQDAYQKIRSIEKVAPYYLASSYREPLNNLISSQKKFDEALKCLAEAEASTVLPQNQKAWINEFRCTAYILRGRNALLKKNFEDAEKDLAAIQALKGLPGRMNPQIAAFEVDLALARGRQLRTEKKYAEAEAVFKKALEVKNASVYSRQNAMNEMARTLLLQKKSDEARKYLDEMSALPGLVPNQVAINCSLLADICIQEKKYDEAIQAAEKIVSLQGNLHPNWKASAYAKIASVYFYYRKDLAKADEYIRKAGAVSGATWGKSPSLAKAIQKAVDAAKK